MLVNVVCSVWVIVVSKLCYPEELCIGCNVFVAISLVLLHYVSMLVGMHVQVGVCYHMLSVRHGMFIASNTGKQST